MKQILAGVLCLSSVVFFGCETGEQSKSGANASSNSALISNANATEMPKTERADGEYVQSGTGTEKVESEIAALLEKRGLKNVPILRLDRDTTARKGAHAKIRLIASRVAALTPPKLVNSSIVSHLEHEHVSA